MTEERVTYETAATGTPVPETLVVPCEVYSRIVGYLTPVQNWNTGKKQEYADRVPFNPAAAGGQA